MDSLLALLPVPAYAAIVGALALLGKRILGDDDTGIPALFRIEPEPGPRSVAEEEPVRWNIERLNRPSRSENAPASASLPTGAAGGLEGACVH